MRKKHRSTLESVYRHPVPTDIKWADAEAMLKALGAEVKNTGGSGVAVALKGRTLVLDKPHPGNEMPRGMVRRLAKFLKDARVKP